MGLHYSTSKNNREKTGHTYAALTVERSGPLSDG